MNDNEPIIEAKLVNPEPESTTYVQPANQKKFLDNKWAVLAVLFSVTGFLGLPLLWTNKDFSNPERYFWAIVVTIYTVLLIAGAAAICIWSYRQIMNAA